MSQFDLGEHGLVDVEGLVDYLDRFSCLFFIPHFELIEELLIDIVGPVVYLENLASVFRAAHEHKDCQSKIQYLLHLIQQRFLSYGSSSC